MNSIPSQRRPSKRARSQEPKRPLTPPSLAEVWGIVRNAHMYSAPTPEEVAAAAQRRESGGKFLATITIQHMWAAQRPAGDEVHTFSLEAYLGQHGKSETLPERQRTAHERRLREQSDDPQVRASLGFWMLLSTVGIFATAFEAEYTPGGKADRAALGDLYDATDTNPPHPALAALPAPNSYGEHDPRRDTVIHADRLLRFILLQAAPVGEQTDTSV